MVCLQYSWPWRDVDKQMTRWILFRSGLSSVQGQELSTSHTVSGLAGHVVLEGLKVLKAFKHKLTRCPSQEYAISL